MSFPPKSWADVEGYDQDEIVAGFREYREGDPKPGENHSDGYRWGWQNGFNDRHYGEDGLGHIRSQGIALYISERATRH